MPEDRLFHPRLMGSRKVSALTAFEQLVWRDMILLADDYGVLIDRAARLRGHSDFLSGHHEEIVSEAMATVIKVGLFLRFVHQEQPFVCDPTWQDYQRIEYPRRTYLPVPTLEALKQCTTPTIALFARYHPAAEDISRHNEEFGELSANALREDAESNRKSRKSGRVPRSVSRRLVVVQDSLLPDSLLPGVQERGSGGEVWPSPSALIRLWNENAPPTLPRVETPTAGRLRKYMTYLRQFPERSWWEAVVSEYFLSKFLLGKKNGPDHDNFKADLDWLCSKGKTDQVENCVKVHEGKYRDGSTRARPTGKTAGNDAAFDQAGKDIRERYEAQ